MKMVRFSGYIRILFAVVIGSVMSACIDADVLYDQQQGEIAILPASSVQSKAVTGPVTGTVYPIEETMGIIAYESDMVGTWTGSIDEASLYIDRGEFKYDDFYGQWAGWDGTAHFPYYWPSNGSLIFAGYSPYRRNGVPVENVSFSVTDKTLRIAGYVVEEYEPMTEAQMYDGSIQYENTNQSDLMYFLPRSDANGNYIGVNNAGSYSAAFHHALALVIFNVEAETGDDVDYIRLRSIALGGMPSAGDLSVQMNNTARGNVSWSRSGNASIEKKVVLDNPSVYGGMKLSTDFRKVVEILAIPMGTHDIEITYSLIVNGKPHEETMTFQGQWEAGNKYVYNLILGTDNIQLVPQITTDWVTNE